MKRIAYMGTPGSFSHLTALEEFGVQQQLIGVKTFAAVFAQLENGGADYAVLPIENSLVGSIYENYDLLNQHTAQIIAERCHRVEHCLLIVPKARGLSDVKKVLSHPKALEQCAGFFKRHPWLEAVAHADTASAAATVADWADPACAAIASAQAGEIYGLARLATKIADNQENYTRFVVIAQQPTGDVEGDKCSLVLSLPHVPGSLAAVLSAFAAEGVNLTKIESRPMHGTPFEYLFYVDFEFARRARREIEELLKLVLHQVTKLKILGFYNGYIKDLA